MTISLFFSLSFLYYILYASTFLFSLFPFCHLLWEGMRECENVLACWNEVDNLFYLPVLSLIGFVEKMFVHCRFILFDYYYCRVSSAKCWIRLLLLWTCTMPTVSIFFMMKKKLSLLTVDMWWWMLIRKLYCLVYHISNHYDMALSIWWHCIGIHAFSHLLWL